MGYYRLPPKKAFCHTITYLAVIGEDDWGKPVTKSIEIKHCWFNRQTLFGRSGNNSAETAANASVTMTYRYSGDIPDFKVGTSIKYEGDEYAIIVSKPLILNGQEIGWRLEVK